MALRLAPLFIAIGALVPACGTYPAGGVAALEIAETRDDATRGTSRVRGPASFRLAGRDLIVTARFLRESARGTRRGDLFVVLSLPLPVTRGTYFRGAPLRLSGAYRETGISGAEPESYELRGETRVEAAYGGPLRVAVDLDLGGPRRLALRGILASGESLPDGRLDLGGLDLEIWADGFDPFLAYEVPEHDFDAYAAIPEYEWATAPPSPFEGPGASVGPGGDSAGGASPTPGSGAGDADWDRDEADGDFDDASAANCSGGDEWGDASTGCGGGAGAEAGSCEGGDAGAEAGSCEGGDFEAGDCSAGDSHFAIVRSGPARTMAILAAVLLLARGRRRSRLRRGEGRAQARQLLLHPPEVGPLPVDPAAPVAPGEAPLGLADVREEAVGDLGRVDLEEPAVAGQAAGEARRPGGEAQGAANLDELVEGMVGANEEVRGRARALDEARIAGEEEPALAVRDPGELGVAPVPPVEGVGTEEAQGAGQAPEHRIADQTHATRLSPR
jgi:hypothetical protein